MAEDAARRAIPDITYDGKAANLEGYLKDVTYEDVASGSSDSMTVTLQNIDEKWLNQWYPTKGKQLAGDITFQDWDAPGKDLTLKCGTFILDEISFSGGPLEASFSALSIPANDSFNCEDRTKTWENLQIKKIAKTIADRYGLSLSYDGPTITVAAMEQSEKTDSEFLYELCSSYGLAMKVYNSKIVIYDQTAMEQKATVATLARDAWTGDAWEYTDALLGVYTGARISYKRVSDDEEISVYLGLVKETANNARTLNITEVADSESDAYYKAAAQVNASNQEATTITATIWPDPKICAGVTVDIEGLGKIDGKYFIDKSTTEVSGSGETVQTIEAHKCQERLTYTPQTKTKTTSSRSSSYKVGDTVNFKGGTHYETSYSGSKGYKATAGKAKITIINSKGDHPYHLIHTGNDSNVYGWVDKGTFE